MAEYTSPYIPQRKILRVFEMLSLLAGSNMTITQLSGSLGMTERSIYRYIYLLEEIGFQVKRQGMPPKFHIGSDYYPAFVSFFREDVWKIKARINEKPEQTRRRELLKQEMEVTHG